VKVPPRFVSTERHLQDLLHETKLMTCPHCGRGETLIGHGMLRGYAREGGELVIRGRRVFCSNRHRRRGCGRTVSVLLAPALRGFTVWASTLAAFIVAVVAGASRKAAWQHASGNASTSSGYRLWRRLDQAQVHIRAKLFTLGVPPASLSAHPWAQLLDHLKSVAPSAVCVFAAFQELFQVDLLG
jgi:hypothetical protein